MDFFYARPQNISSNALTIDEEEFTHLTHVMRKQIGDEIFVVDGKGNAYRTTIESISKRAAECRIHNQLPNLNEASQSVTIAVAVLKNPSRFDFLVEKVTELGVNCIIPLTTERTIPHHAKADRWQKIALAAMKQSGRCILPHVGPLTLFKDFLRDITADVKLIAHEKAGKITPWEKGTGSAAICIGPEGGFSDEEVGLASQNGFLQIGLGKRRLRTETAAIVAATKILLSDN